MHAFLDRSIYRVRQRTRKAVRRITRATQPRICYLHIGMNKAGSSTVQHAFKGYDDGDLGYLRLPGTANHSRAVCLRFRQPPPRGMLHGQTPDQRAREIRQVSEAFDRAVAACPGSVLISAEYFVTFTDDADVTRVLRYFRDRFDRVVALAYIRPPEGFILSSIQQRVKHTALGQDFGFACPVYRESFAAWVRHLPEADRHFIPLSAQHLIGGDLLSDVAARIGVPKARQPLRSGPARNASLSAEATAVLACFRAGHGASGGSQADRQAEARMVRMLEGFGDTSIALHPDTMHALLQRRRDDIAWIETLMGTQFPLHVSKRPSKSFATPEDILAYGTALAPELAHWLGDTVPSMRSSTDTPADMLAQAVAHIRGGL